MLNPVENQSVNAMLTLETACWTVLLLAPLLRWVNGPAVSVDQFVTQIALVCIAAVGAIGLRIRKWRRRQQPQSGTDSKKVN